jgi:hypothetical protein
VEDSIARLFFNLKFHVCTCKSTVNHSLMIQVE